MESQYKSINPPPSTNTAPPDINIKNVDTSSITSNQKPIEMAFKTFIEKLESSSIPASQKRIVADASKRIGMLLFDLNAGKISQEVGDLILGFVKALTAGQSDVAMKLTDQLTDNAWDDSSAHWLVSFKRLIRLRQYIK